MAETQNLSETLSRPWEWGVWRNWQMLNLPNIDLNTFTNIYKYKYKVEYIIFPPFWMISLALLFRAGFKWRLQENRFFLVFGLIIHFMATTTKAKRCIFISRTPKCPGADEVGEAGRRYRLFSALLRAQFGPIWIMWGHGWWKLWQIWLVKCGFFFHKVFHKISNVLYKRPTATGFRSNFAKTKAKNLQMVSNRRHKNFGSEL